jgi:hypothetical protein
MLKLDFTFSEEWNESVNPLELPTMSEVDLRYRVALGDLILIANGVDLSAAWGWIPMIDMALALHDIREQLLAKSSAEAVFEFTESDATITAERNDNDVRITASYGPRSEIVPFSEFGQAVSAFLDKVFRESVKRFPTLEANAAFRSLRARTVFA